MQTIADHEADTACRLHVGPVPVALTLGHADERITRRTRPVKAVAAEADAQIVGLLAIGRLAAEDREEAEHHAFVGDGVEVVELGGHVAAFAHRIERIRGDPRHRLALRPPRRAELGALVIPANAIQLRVVVTQAEAPTIAKRIEEAGAAIAGRPRITAIGPANAIGRRRQVQRRVALHRRPRHLESRRGISFVEIEPHRAGVAAMFADDVGAGDDVCGAARPRDAVRRCGEGGVLLVAGHVPHLEDAIGGIEEHAVAEDHRGGTGRGLRHGRVRIVDLPRLLGREQRVRRVIHGLVKVAMQRRLFDQEVVDEQLPADVDVDDLRRAREVGRAFGRSATAGRAAAATAARA